MTRLLYVQYTNPAEYPPLEHSSRIFAREGWEVLFLGTTSLTGEVIQFPPHERIAVRLLPFCTPGLRQKLHYLWFSVWVVWWVARWRPEWVYASDVLACPIALLLSFLPILKVVYHEHDLPSPTTRSAAIRLSLRARATLARRAAFCIFPNNARAARFSESFPDSSPVASVWNCPLLEEVGPQRGPIAAAQLKLFYHGTIVPARLPLTVIQALERVPDGVTLTVVGFETVGFLGYRKQLATEARRLGIEERLELVDPIPTRRELLDCCRRADVGLSFMPRESSDPNLETMVGASNKPFDYLACGVALLVSDLPNWRRAYADPGYGLACDPHDAASVATAIQWFLEHPEEVRAMGERGRLRVAAEWNYEHQFLSNVRLLFGRASLEGRLPESQDPSLAQR